LRPLRILLADDHNVVRNGLRLILQQQPDFQVVGEASDGREAVRLAESESPDVVVMDIGMPNLNGIEATRRIVSSRPKIAVAILSMHTDEGYVVRSMKAGVRAYLLKDSAEADLIAAIRAISQGKSFFSPAIRKLLQEDFIRQLEDNEVEDTYDLLSTREREILQLAAEGKTNKEMAAALNTRMNADKRE
jgi:two-component system response regulator NreC